MTITELLGNLKIFFENYADEVTVMDEAYNIPKTFPSICIDVVSSTPIQMALGSEWDERKIIEVTYYDEVGVQTDNIAFLQNVEDMKKAFLQSDIAQNDYFVQRISSRKGTHDFAEGKWFKELILIEGDVEI